MHLLISLGHPAQPLSQKGEEELPFRDILKYTVQQTLVSQNNTYTHLRSDLGKPSTFVAVILLTREACHFCLKKQNCFQMNAFVAKWTVKLSSESCGLTINHIEIQNKYIEDACFQLQLVEHVSYIFRKKKKKGYTALLWPREGLRLLTKKIYFKSFLLQVLAFACSIHPTLPWSWERPALLAKGLLASCNFPVCHHPSCSFFVPVKYKIFLLLYL